MCSTTIETGEHLKVSRSATAQVATIRASGYELDERDKERVSFRAALCHSNMRGWGVIRVAVLAE